MILNRLCILHWGFFTLEAQGSLNWISACICLPSTVVPNAGDSSLTTYIDSGVVFAEALDLLLTMSMIVSHRNARPSLYLVLQYDWTCNKGLPRKCHIHGSHTLLNAQKQHLVRKRTGLDSATQSFSQYISQICMPRRIP